MFSVRCPICQQVMEVGDLSEWPSFPFCGERCKIIYLGRWLGESYRVPTEATDAEPEENGAESSP